MDREIDSHKEKKLQISEKQRLLITAYRVSGLNRKATGFDSCTSNNGQRIETERQHRRSLLQSTVSPQTALDESSVMMNTAAQYAKSAAIRFTPTQPWLVQG